MFSMDSKSFVDYSSVRSSCLINLVLGKPSAQCLQFLRQHHLRWLSIVNVFRQCVIGKCVGICLCESSPSALIHLMGLAVVKTENKQLMSKTVTRTTTRVSHNRQVSIVDYQLAKCSSWCSAGQNVFSYTGRCCWVVVHPVPLGMSKISQTNGLPDDLPSGHTIIGNV